MRMAGTGVRMRGRSQRAGMVLDVFVMSRPLLIPEAEARPLPPINPLKTKSRRGDLNPGPADYESGRRCVEASLKFPLLETTIPVPRCPRTLKYAGIRRRNLSGT